MDMGLRSAQISGLPSADDIFTSVLGRVVVVALLIVIVCAVLKYVWSGQLAIARSVSMAAGAVTAVLLIGVQILWLWTCYVIGNGWSYFLFTYLDAEMSRSGGSRSVPSWKRATASLGWDPFTIGYVGVCCLALVAAYTFLLNHPESRPGRVVHAEDRGDGTLRVDEPAPAFFGDGSGIFYLIMLPSVLFGAVAAVVTTLAIVTALFDKLDGKTFTLGAAGDNWASLTLALLITSLATALVMQTLGLIFRGFESAPKPPRSST